MTDLESSAPSCRYDSGEPNHNNHKPFFFAHSRWATRTFPSPKPPESLRLDDIRGTDTRPTIASVFPFLYHAGFFIQYKVPFTLISWYLEGVYGHNFTHSLTR